MSNASLSFLLLSLSGRIVSSQFRNVFYSQLHKNCVSNVDHSTSGNVSSLPRSKLWLYEFQNDNVKQFPTKTQLDFTTRA